LRQFDTLQPTVSTLLTFLQSSYEDGSGHSTLGTLRSVVALLAPLLDGKTIGEDKLVMRFMKGVSKLRPPKPRYKYTWDPSPVLTYLSSIGPLDSITLQLLSEKLLVLLALCTGQRMQTLHAIDIRHIENLPNGVQIRVDKLLKTSKPGAVQPCLYLPRFDSESQLCPVRTLTEYLNRTQGFRTGEKHQLFLSLTGNHKPITTQTMSRWVKNVLNNSGINSSIFCAHSTRHASTSAAARHGVSMDQIFAAAGWSSSSSTFARFYNRPVINRGSFAEAVLLSNPPS